MNRITRYSSLCKSFNEKIPDIKFEEIIAKLDTLYKIQKTHQKDPDFYRDLYSKTLNIESDNNKNFLEKLTTEEREALSSIGSYKDITSPIDEYIKNNPDKLLDRKEMMSKIPDLSDVLEFQEAEISELEKLLESQLEQISEQEKNQTLSKETTLSKQGITSFAKDENIALETQNALEDITTLEKTREVRKNQNTPNLE